MVRRPWMSADSTVLRPTWMTSSTVWMASSTVWMAPSTVLRPRRIASFTVFGIRSLLERARSGYRLNHNLHGAGLWVRSNVDGFNGLLEREPVGNKLGEVEAAAIAVKNETGDFVENVERRRVGSEQRLFIHAHCGGIKRGLAVLRLREEHHLAAGTCRIHGREDQRVA